MDRAKFDECVDKVLKCEDVKLSARFLFDYFRDHLPLDFLTVVAYDSMTNMCYNRIHATDENVVFIKDSVAFSEDALKYTKAIFNGQPNTFLIENGRKHPLVREFDTQVGINETASIIMYAIPLKAGKHVSFNLVAWGESIYTSADRSYIQALSESLNTILRHIYSSLTQSSDGTPIRIKRQQNGLHDEMIGRRHGLRETILLADMVAKLPTPVLLFGESGAGKEMLATRIHQNSNRKSGPFVCVNCGGIPETLIDSELFGYEKGAFTGAEGTRKGYFGQADGGTILLDEISELSKAAQAKLLRVLQSQSFHRVGGEHAAMVDVRVIAATNRDLEEMVNSLEFRKDLWYRLNTFPIKIPPLRKRKADIVPLAHHFARTLASELSLPYKYRFERNAMAQLQDYDWPGNVRELKNTVEYGMILSKGRPISFEFLEERRQKNQTQKKLPKGNEFLTMREMVVNHIRDVLAYTKGRIEGKEGAAEILDMNPSTLRSKMRKLHIKIEKTPP